jgi:putative sterol carrier protein
MSETTQRFADELRSRVEPNRTAGMKATYQFVIADENGAAVHADIRDGQVEVVDGPAPSPDITLTATLEDWQRIVTGDLSGQMAFLTGKLKIQGDMTLAMKLQSVFQFG